jgi:SAM-dependent methyltransferase
MKISELLELRDRLERVYTTAELNRELTRLTFDVSSIDPVIADPDFKKQVGGLVSNLATIADDIAITNENYKKILSTIQRQISLEEAKFFTDNYVLELKHNAVDVIRNQRVMPLKDTIRNEILDRIRLYTDWKYPALEIGCRDGEWTEYLVAADPLYIVDYYREFIDSATGDFPELYQQRIRKYLLKDYNEISTQLPENQFGFVFCWNFMNYCSFDTIKEYLKIMKKLLRPGGTFMFSYNDGDRPAGAAMAENFFMTYVPKHLLVALCESLGFEIVNQRTRDVSVSWIEVRRPGTLTTVKAHQVLGEIKKIR